MLPRASMACALHIKVSNLLWKGDATVTGYGAGVFYNDAPHTKRLAFTFFLW
jgi:hypothetical protein